MTAVKQPTAEIDQRFSSRDAKPVPWETARASLEKAETFWLSTVRPDGHPHVTTLLAAWLDGALYFCTSDGEQKYRNLRGNPRCVLTTGCNTYREGLDIVVEGKAIAIDNEEKLRLLADIWASKYDWPWQVGEGKFLGDEGNVATVFEVRPVKALGFAKGDAFSQTRWRLQ